MTHGGVAATDGSGMGSWQRVLKAFMLFASKFYCFGIVTIQHLHSERQIVTASDLIHEPSDAMGFVFFVARHNVN